MRIDRLILPFPDDTACALLRRLFPRRGCEVVVVGPDARRAAFDLRQEGFAARARTSDPDLLHAAAEEAADLILVSAPPGRGFLHVLNGDAAERLLRSSPVPVAVAHEPPAEEIRNVVVPLDGGGVGRSALPVAGALARALDARVTLVHVNPDGWAHPHWTREWTSIADAEHELRASLVPVATVTRRGRPASEILRACAEERGNLLVLGTRARLTPARRLFGSVTEALIHASPVPLVLVPSRREAAATPEPVIGLAP